MSMINPVRLRLDRISVQLSGHRIIEDLSLLVEPGEIISLLGPSGCGKTTTLRVIAGIIRPDSGDVWLDARRVTNLPSHQRNVGMVFQNYALFPHMSLIENVLFGLKMQSVPTEERHVRAARMLEFLQLSAFANSYPDKLSGGQQQRAALARTLVVQPAVLLLDEPLSALDRQLRDAMRTELRTLLKQVGITTIIVTHDQEEALTLADRVAVMRDGKIEQIGVPREVYHHPANRFVASFIGHTNYIPGQVLTMDDHVVTVGVGASIVKAYGAKPLPVGGRVELAIRPETISVSADRRRPETGHNCVTARLCREVFIGGSTHLHFELEDRTPVVVSTVSLDNSAPNARSGSEFCLSWPVERSVAFAADGAAKTADSR
ncbi:MAG: ABC transporter ATP-binding protein [Proteobacteria bacterium]|nr:ABC transporter ATP-binding protein [Pseudomonadota bacterium]MBI3499654.1 ABC transporter ATP-binding protein [Pseudomonadota bacterium]